MSTVTLSKSEQRSESVATGRPLLACYLYTPTPTRSSTWKPCLLSNLLVKSQLMTTNATFEPSFALRYLPIIYLALCHLAPRSLLPMSCNSRTTPPGRRWLRYTPGQSLAHWDLIHFCPRRVIFFVHG
jgi:hypothetical protein